MPTLVMNEIVEVQEDRGSILQLRIMDQEDLVTFSAGLNDNFEYQVR